MAVPMFQAAGYDFAPGEPRVDTSNRDSIIRWLSWNDRNGSYSDRACEIEGIEPLTLATAQQALVTAWNESTGEPMRFPFEVQHG